MGARVGSPWPSDGGRVKFLKQPAVGPDHLLSPGSLEGLLFVALEDEALSASNPSRNLLPLSSPDASTTFVYETIGV